MASTTQKWLTGCGIGCGVIVLIIAGLGAWGFFTVRSLKDRADTLETRAAAIDSLYGKPEAFTPDPSGVIPAGRMEDFLEVQETLAEPRARLRDDILALDGKGEGGVLGKIRGAKDIVPAIFDFIDARNAALLDVEMGLGELHHVQALAWFGLLGKDPGDGPGFALNSGDDESDTHVVIRREYGEDKAEQARRDRARTVRRMVNELETKILANQLAALEADGVLAARAPGWRDSLAAEIDALRRDKSRLPWQDGLPDRIADSLAPYRELLEESYEPMTMMVEIGLADDH